MNAPHDPRPRTAVLHQFTGIGDLIWHIQYFKAVAAHSHGGKVLVIAQPSTKARAILSQEPWVEDIMDHDHRPRRGDGAKKGVHSGLTGMWRMARELKALQLDRIVMFSGRPSRGLIAALAGIPERLAYGYSPVQRCFLSHGPYVQRYRGPSVAVLKETADFAIAHGFCSTPLRPQLDVPPAVLERMQAALASLPARRVTLAVGTSEAHKQWGAAKFAGLAQRLAEHGQGVILLGGPAEEALMQEIRDQVSAAAQPLLHTISRGTVLESAAVLSCSALCIGNDTGMVNIAAAVGRPTYVLLGNRPVLDHDPLIHSLTAPSLAKLTVDTVWQALPSEHTLAKTSEPGAGQEQNQG